jgi:hypothetical protein
MKAIVNLGKITLEIEEKDEMETLHKAIVLSNPRFFCNVCKDREAKKYWTTNKDTEGNTYVNFACSCGAKSKLGRYKTGGYFWREYEKYDPDKKETLTKE